VKHNKTAPSARKKTFTWLWKNPVFRKEIRAFMRQSRTRRVLLAYLSAVSAVLLLVYFSIISSNAAAPDPNIRRVLGKMIFLSATSLQLVAIIFIAPSYSANLISAEIETDTFDLLRATPFPAGSMVKGKIAASFIFMLLFLVTGLPLHSVAYILGGVEIAALLGSIAMLLTTAIFLSAYGVWSSAKLSQTAASVGTTFITASSLTIGVPALMFLFMRLSPLHLDQDFFGLLDSITAFFPAAFQPLASLFIWLAVSSTPVTAAYASMAVFQKANSAIWYNFNNNASFQFPFLSPWIIFMAMYGVITWFLYRAAVKQVAQKDYDIQD